MENASKALIIAGAILLSILIIAIGIFVFNGANSTITDSMTSMSTQEIEAFNNQFTSYDGKQSGSNVKALMVRLIANSNTYVDEPDKVPSVEYRIYKSQGEPTKYTGRASSGNNSNYVKYAGEIRGLIDNKHEYTVLLEYNNKGLIDIVKIYYEYI